MRIDFHLGNVVNRMTELRAKSDKLVSHVIRFCVVFFSALLFGLLLDCDTHSKRCVVNQTVHEINNIQLSIVNYQIITKKSVSIC